jgi:hypothetical protein
MAADDWKKVADRFYTPEEQAHWAERATALAKDFDQGAYQRQWQDLAARIEAALPLDPGSDRAQAFYDEWQALLAPFTAVATPQMMAGATKLYGSMEQWSGKDGMPQTPFPMQVWEFVRAAGQARKDRESA